MPIVTAAVMNMKSLSVSQITDPIHEYIKATKSIRQLEMYTVDFCIDVIGYCAYLVNRAYSLEVTVISSKLLLAL